MPQVIVTHPKFSLPFLFVEHIYEQEFTGVAPLVGHSLSWDRKGQGPKPTSANYLKARLWNPKSSMDIRNSNTSDQPPALRPDPVPNTYSNPTCMSPDSCWSLVPPTS